MKSLLYYPGFEVYNQNWLKFALLYMDELRPIIPPDAEHDLSPRFRALRRQTDLIKPYYPPHSVAYKATVDAINQCDTILSRPEPYHTVFKTTQVRELWKYRPGHTYKIYSGKYTSEFRDFVTANGFGRHVNGGVAVSAQLGAMFMTLLAHTIADEESIPAVTDRPELDRFGVFCRRRRPKSRNALHVARGIIKLAIPANLESIDIKKIIKLREKKGFKDRLHGFQKEVNKYFKAIESRTAKGDFFSTRGSVWRDFSDEIVSLGAGVVPIAFGAWLLITSPPENWGEFATTIAETGVLSVSSIITIRAAMERTRSRRYARKYMVDLDKLGRMI